MSPLRGVTSGGQLLVGLSEQNRFLAICNDAIFGARRSRWRKCSLL